MRLNRFIAQYSSYSRRKADELIAGGRVVVNRQIANLGTTVEDTDTVMLDGKRLIPVQKQLQVVLLHKPIGFVCSKDGQGSPTVYDLLQKGMQNLNVAGRLDKDSSGLVVMTDDGKLLQELTHPSNDKEKIYIATLGKPLEDGAIAKIAKGINIGDERISKMSVLPLPKDSKYTNAKLPSYEVRIYEGRNRQIRRSFEALGYQVTSLHRIQLGPYSIEGLAPKQFKVLE